MEMEAGVVATWPDLGAVHTIYEDDEEEEEEEEEEDDDDDGSSSPICSSPSPPIPSLLKAVHQWSKESGSKADVTLRVQEHCLPLHRRRLLASRSRYLRQQLADDSDAVTVTLPSGLTADAFAIAVSSFYGVGMVLTPANLAAVWAVCAWLELSDSGEVTGLANLVEDYFFQEVATDADHTAQVLRSCRSLLQGEAAKHAAQLMARCVDVLAGYGGADGEWLDVVVALPVAEFHLVLEAMRSRFAYDHDLLYTVLDHYLQNHKEKIGEEERTRLSYAINSTKLSPQLFLHLVQNPHLPLRFVVQAMLVDQLHSHRTFVHHAAATASSLPARFKPVEVGTWASADQPFRCNKRGDGEGAMTLGEILRQEAARREAVHLRASMEATSNRIESLERQLASLRSCLKKSKEVQRNSNSAAFVGAQRSSSFRIVRCRDDFADSPEMASAVSDVKPAKSRSSGPGKLMKAFRSLFGRSGTAAAERKPTVGEIGTPMSDEAAGRRNGHRRSRSLQLT